jgi:transcriptional regulator with XRE-family HTH domain
MDTQGAASFGKALQAALRACHMTQAELARHLKIDAGQVSRWVNGKAMPHFDTVQRIEEVLGATLAGTHNASSEGYELFVSAPITGLDSSDVPEHHDALVQVMSAVRQHVERAYWPGESITTADQLVAADIATEQNMKVLANCVSYLYLQFVEVVHPSGALVELGLALGRRIRTTLIIRNGLHIPYMIDGFSAVAARLNFLPDVRIYTVASASDAANLIARNGRQLLGLA